MDITQSVTIKCETGYGAELAFEYLDREYPDYGWDIYDKEVKGSNYVDSFHYTPAVYVDFNGEGHPDAIEYEGLGDWICEDILKATGVKCRFEDELTRW